MCALIKLIMYSNIYVYHKLYLEFFLFTLLAFIILAVLVPYFTQNPQSYLTYPMLREAYLDFDIDISFRPEVTDGLYTFVVGVNVTFKHLRSYRDSACL